MHVTFVAFKASAQRNSLVREQFAGVCFAEKRSTIPARRRLRKRVLLCVVNARHVFNSCFFAIETLQRSHFHWNPIARHSPASQKKTSLGTVSKHVMSYGGVATQTHISEKRFSTEHAQELSLQRVPCQNAPSPVESLPAAPSCVGWAFHDRMKCHVISHQVHTCFVPFGVPHCVKLPSQSLISPT